MRVIKLLIFIALFIPALSSAGTTIVFDNDTGKGFVYENDGKEFSNLFVIIYPDLNIALVYGKKGGEVWPISEFMHHFKAKNEEVVIPRSLIIPEKQLEGPLQWAK